MQPRPRHRLTGDAERGTERVLRCASRCLVGARFSAEELHGSAANEINGTISCHFVNVVTAKKCPALRSCVFGNDLSNFGCRPMLSLSALVLHRPPGRRRDSKRSSAPRSLASTEGSEKACKSGMTTDTL